MIPRVNSRFAGCGLIEIGLLEAGVEVQQSFEIDEACCTTHGRNFRHEMVRCDLRTRLVKDQKARDVEMFTFPCSRYSGAAAIHGQLTGDELFLHALRNIAVDPPEVFVVENVPGMRKFPVVMEALCELPGRYTHIVCPLRSELWLPQRRDRLIIISSRRPFSWRPPARPRRRTHLRDVLEADPQVHTPGYVLRRLDGGYRDQPIISDPAKGDIAPTCVAHYAKDRSTRLVVDSRVPRGVRPYTVREYARLQGVPDWFQFPASEAESYRMIGNGVSVPVGRWIGRELRRYFGS
jgi:DNA (cytosine-5)-methyltransferase 1